LDPRQQPRSFMHVDVALDKEPAAGESDSFDRYNKEGLAHFKQGKLAEAVRSFEQALEIRRDIGTLHNLGVAFAELGKLEEAVACFRETLETNDAALTTQKNL